MRCPDLVFSSACLGLVGACALLAAGCDRAAPAAKTQQVELTVTGMHCQSCVAAIKAGVKDLDGVVDCEVSLEPQRVVATVSDPAAAQRITDKVKRMGYGVAGN